jgi:hypothetical protein
MRIQFERTGGFAGMRTAATIDTNSLSPGDRQELQQLVEAAGFFKLPPEVAGRPQRADQFQYKLTVESEGQQHTVEVGEASAPESLRPLLRKLTALARSRT